MRRKVIQNYADTICQMFCGWQLMNDFKQLDRLGSGLLTIDLRTGACVHDGKPTDQLSIARILQAWFFDRCARDAVPTDALTKVLLEAELTISLSDTQRDTSMRFSDPRPPFVGCDIRCRSSVDTDEGTYRGEFTDFEEWPRDGAGQARKLKFGEWEDTIPGPAEVESGDAS